MARYRGQPGYIDFNKEIELARSRRLEDMYADIALRNDARAHRAEQRTIENQIYERQRQESFRAMENFKYDMEMRFKVLSGLKGAPRDHYLKRMNEFGNSIQVPAHKQLWEARISGTPVDPRKMIEEDFRKNNHFPTFEDIPDGLSDDMEAIALGDVIEGQYDYKARLAKTMGEEPPAFDPFQRVGLDKVYANGKVVPLKDLKIEEMIKKVDSTDTVESALKNGFVTSAKRGETFSRNGMKQFVYDRVNILTGKKSIYLENAGWGSSKAGSGGEGGGWAGISKEDRNLIKKYQAVDLFSEAIDADDYEGEDKEILATIQTLHQQMDEAGADEALRKKITAEFYERRFPGVVATVVDESKFKETGFLESMFGADVEWNSGSKYGKLAIMPGERFPGLKTADGAMFEAILGANGYVYDTNLRTNGKKFIGPDGGLDREGFIEWTKTVTKEDLGMGEPEKPSIPEPRKKSLTLGDVNRYMSGPWIKMWYGLDSLTMKVYDALRTVGEKPDYKALQDSLVRRGNEWNKGNLKDAYETLLEFGMDAYEAARHIEDMRIPFTEGMGR